MAQLHAVTAPERLDVVASGCYAAAEADELRRLLERNRAHVDCPVAPSLLPITAWRGRDPAAARAYRRECVRLAAWLRLNP